MKLSFENDVIQLRKLYDAIDTAREQGDYADLLKLRGELEAFTQAVVARDGVKYWGLLHSVTESKGAIVDMTVMLMSADSVSEVIDLLRENGVRDIRIEASPNWINVLEVANELNNNYFRYTGTHDYAGVYYMTFYDRVG